MPPNDDNQNLQKKHVTKQVSSNIFFSFLDRRAECTILLTEPSLFNATICQGLRKQLRQRKKEINSGETVRLYTHRDKQSEKLFNYKLWMPQVKAGQLRLVTDPMETGGEESGNGQGETVSLPHRFSCQFRHHQNKRRGNLLLLLFSTSNIISKC